MRGPVNYTRPAAILAAVSILLTGCTTESTPQPFLGVPNPSATATPATTETPPAPAPAPNTYRVDRVVDGDTVRILRDGKSVPLRLIGGDTPETVHPRMDVECYGPEASAEAKRLLEGQRVKVVYDPTQGDLTEDGYRVDKYDRDLVYLELPDGRDFMEHMIENGYAEEYRYRSDYQRMPAYNAAETQAMLDGAGLWSQCK